MKSQDSRLLKRWDKRQDRLTDWRQQDKPTLKQRRKDKLKRLIERHLQ